MTPAKRKSMLFLIVTLITFFLVLVAVQNNNPVILLPALGFWAFMTLGQAAWELWKVMVK